MDSPDVIAAREAQEHITRMHQRGTTDEDMEREREKAGMPASPLSRPSPRRMPRVSPEHVNTPGAATGHSITTTESEIARLVAEGVRAELARAGISTQQIDESRRTTVRTQAEYFAARRSGQEAVPELTMAQAKELCDSQAERGVPIEMLFTAEGWYCHPLAGYIPPPTARV